MSVKRKKRPEKKKPSEPDVIAQKESTDRGNIEHELDLITEAIEKELDLQAPKTLIKSEKSDLEKAIESELDLLESKPVVDAKKRLREQEAERLRAILPLWCEKPWMYVTPTNLDQLSSWNSAWGDFLLEYAEIKAAHILNLLELRKEFPFSNRVIKKQLSIGQLQQIGVALVEKDFAVWRDERKTRLRVYWRGLDEWGDTIYEWAVQNGYEIASLFELTNIGEIWSTMPLDELLQVLQMLVTRKRAKWVGKDKKTVQFEIYSGV
jgi:hypothetical protein